MSTVTPHPVGRRPEFLTGFAAMHEAMRRDTRRLVHVSERLAEPVTERRGRALASWWTQFERVIVHHHEREDDIVWPALEHRRPEFSAQRCVLESDHHALDDAMAGVRLALAASAEGADEIAVRRNAIVEFATLLDTHLEREEGAAFPLIAAAFTASEYGQIEQQMAKGPSLGQIAFELPWVLDGAGPAVHAFVANLLPAPVRLLNRFLFTPRYRRITATLASQVR